MRKRLALVLVLVLAVVVIAGGVMYWTNRPKPGEPVYKGMTAAEWEGEISLWLMWQTPPHYSWTRYGVVPIWRRLLEKFHLLEHQTGEENATPPIGPNAVPVLIKLLQSESSLVRRTAAYALGRTGPPAIGAVPALNVALNSNDVDLASDAQRALKNIMGSVTPQSSGQTLP